MASLRRNDLFLTSCGGTITCFVAGDVVGSVFASSARVLRFGGRVIELTEAEHALLTQPDVAEEAAPVAEEAAPVAEEAAPVAEEAAPVAGEAAPVVEEATPVVAEEGTPVTAPTPLKRRRTF